MCRPSGGYRYDRTGTETQGGFEQLVSSEEKGDWQHRWTGHSVAEVARDPKCVSSKKTTSGANGEEIKGISLSSLLNAIDWVAPIGGSSQSPSLIAADSISIFTSISRALKPLLTLV